MMNVLISLRIIAAYFAVHNQYRSPLCFLSFEVMRNFSVLTANVVVENLLALNTKHLVIDIKFMGCEEAR